MYFIIKISMADKATEVKKKPKPKERKVNKLMKMEKSLIRKFNT